jgi:hypothetical protein
MKLEKFDDLVNKRISKDSDILNKQIEKERQTIKYLYKTILHEFAEEIEKNIESYNDVLSKNYKYLNIGVYYGDFYKNKGEAFSSNSIMIVFKERTQKEPQSQTPKTNFNHLNISIEHVPGLDENEYFRSNYHIATNHAVYEKKEIKTSVNEINKDKIIDELRNFYHSFLEAFFDRGYDGSLFTKKI